VSGTLLPLSDLSHGERVPESWLTADPAVNSFAVAVNSSWVPDRRVLLITGYEVREEEMNEPICGRSRTDLRGSTYARGRVRRRRC
jgi:hypothetical protein